MTDPAALGAMRRSYLRGVLDESTVAPTWLAQLLDWFGQAADDLGSVEANAIQLATVGVDGRPAVRTVLAKAIDERGVVFYTGYDSAKGRALDANPHAEAVFVWLAHERQVRVRGRVERVAREQTEAYFASRPRGSRLGAWASPQSEVVASRAVLDELYHAAERRFDGHDVPVPPNWGGYRIVPDAVEFWQGRQDRLHDRLRFRADGDAWVLERLAP